MEINLTYREGEYKYDNPTLLRVDYSYENNHGASVRDNRQTYDRNTDYIAVKPEMIGMQTDELVLYLSENVSRIFNYFHEDYGYMLIIKNKPLDTSKFLEAAKSFIVDDVEKAKILHMVLRRISSGITQEELDSIRFLHTKSAKIN
jgi:hypothetical protein